MSQARDNHTALTFDSEERAVLTKFGFRFETTDGQGAAELNGRCQVTFVAPRRGEEFEVSIIIPGKIQLVAHTPRSGIVWGAALPSSCRVDFKRSGRRR
jgi:hypothetical protein